MLQTGVGNPLSASLANSVASFVHPAKGLLQFVDAQVAQAGGSLAHFLHLHRIQAREPADRDIHRDRLRIDFLVVRFRPQQFEFRARLNLKLDLFIHAQHPDTMQVLGSAGKKGHRNGSPARFQLENLAMMNAARLLTLATLAASGYAGAHPEHEFMAGLSAPSPATVLLITSPELVEAWKPFAQWKKRLGKPVRILSTKQIDDRYEAPDLQEKIRRCVRNHTDHLGTRWIILGGDSEPNGKGVVPDRDTVHKTRWGDYQHIPTDVFYLSKKDWDADDDGIFGEWEEDRDSIDYPDGDVGLGRIPVRTAADVKAYTEKVIAYESQYPEKGFATTMAYTCTVPAAYAKVRLSWDSHVSKVLKGGTVHRFFADETPWDQKSPGDYALSPGNWIKLLNDKKAGKLHIHGHGFLPCWVLEDNQLVTEEHVSKLTNDKAYPIITTVSCFTGQFDAAKDPSIAESMLRQPRAGAIAVVAPVREGKPHFHDPKRDFPLMVEKGKLDGTTRTMTQFWEFGIGQKVSAGAAMMLVKAGMAKDAQKAATFHLCLCELNLLGDPTLSLRGTNPRRPDVAGPKSLEAGNLSLIIESDAPGAIVSLLDTHGLYAVQVADETGNTTFPLNVVKDSTLTITVSGPEFNAVTLEIPVK